MYIGKCNMGKCNEARYFILKCFIQESVVLNGLYFLTGEEKHMQYIVFI